MYIRCGVGGAFVRDDDNPLVSGLGIENNGTGMPSVCHNHRELLLDSSLVAFFRKYLGG